MKIKFPKKANVLKSRVSIRIPTLLLSKLMAIRLQRKREGRPHSRTALFQEALEAFIKSEGY